MLFDVFQFTPLCREAGKCHTCQCLSCMIIGILIQGTSHLSRPQMVQGCSTSSHRFWIKQSAVANLPKIVFFFHWKSIIVHKSLKFHEIFDKSPHIPRSRTADSMASAMEDSPSTDGFCGCLSPKGSKGSQNVKTGMVQHSQFVNGFDLLESILHLHIVLMMVVSSYDSSISTAFVQVSNRQMKTRQWLEIVQQLAGLESPPIEQNCRPERSAAVCFGHLGARSTRSITTASLEPETFWKHVKICQDMSRYVKICQDMSRYVKICQDMSRYVKICQDLSRCVKICQDVSRRVKMCQDVSRCVKMCQDLSR